MSIRSDILKGILLSGKSDNIASGLEKEEAIDRAVETCIHEGILKDMLEKHRREAREMLLTEYDEEQHIRNEKQISYEDGLAEGKSIGLAEGLVKGENRLATLINHLGKEDRMLDIAKVTEDVNYRNMLYKEYGL